MDDREPLTVPLLSNAWLGANGTIKVKLTDATDVLNMMWEGMGVLAQLDGGCAPVLRPMLRIELFRASPRPFFVTGYGPFDGRAVHLWRRQEPASRITVHNFSVSPCHVDLWVFGREA